MPRVQTESSSVRAASPAEPESSGRSAAPALPTDPRNESRAGEEAASGPDGATPPTGFRSVDPAERFLQHALGTQGDVGVATVALSLTAIVAVVAVAIRRRKDRRRRDDDAERDVPEDDGT